MKRIALLAIIICFGILPTMAEAHADTVVHIAYSPLDSIQTGDTTAVNRLSAKNIEDQLQTPTEVFDAISFSKIFWTLILLIFDYFIVRLIITLLEVLGERTSKHRIRVKSLIPIVRIAIWGVVIFAIIKGIYDPPLQTLIAMGASITIAVGLAAQDLLKNVFGGLMLLFDRPFQVGDKIEAGQHYGEVLQIGLRATRIVTPDDSVVSIPNMELMNAAVSNANSGELNCQVVAEIYLPIDVDTQKARKIALEAAQVSRFIYLNKPVVVLFANEVNERRSYLKMRVKAYVMDIRYEFQFKSDMTEIIVRELLSEGIISKEDVT
ncbi:MAG: mechanosensitive ion channel [Tenuifilaceae bacterium]|nr:mechanosensitive ion channel [Tenuifilaceae bacterium]